MLPDKYPLEFSAVGEIATGPISYGRNNSWTFETLGNNELYSRKDNVGPAISP